MASASDYDNAASALRRPGSERADGGLDARALVRCATLAASSHNTQPWQFRVQHNVITILPDWSRRCPVVDPDDAHLFKSLGCAAENLVHAAAAQGLAADVRFDAGTDSVVIHLERTATAQATALSRAIIRRQCVKLAYDGQPLAAAALAQLEHAGTGPQVRPMLLLSAAQKDAVLEYVTQGNQAQLTDRAFRNELLSWIRFNPATALQTGDGLSGRTAGQPALPTWLGKRLLRLILTPGGQAATDAKNIRSSAGVAVFVADRDDKAAWVEVGRAYERFALQATAMDIRTAFINQPIEVRPLRPQFAAWLQLGDAHPMLIVRFGHGPTAPFSLRRPLDDVLLSEPPPSRANGLASRHGSTA